MKIKSINPVYRVFLIAVIYCCLTSCTRNNGDIGPWFGSWRLDEITIDGEQSDEYAGNIVWKFQNNVFEMVKILINDYTHGYEVCYATWSEHDEYMLIDFQHHDDVYQPDWDGRYKPFAETHLPVNGVAELKIESQTGSRVQLTYQSPTDGKTYCYKLSKQG